MNFNIWISFNVWILAHNRNPTGKQTIKISLIQTNLIPKITLKCVQQIFINRQWKESKFLTVGKYQTEREYSPCYTKWANMLWEDNLSKIKKWGRLDLPVNLPNFRASQVVLVVKNSPANEEDLKDDSLISESGRSAGEGHGNPLQYSCLEDPMDRGAWQATVHWVTKSWTQMKWLNTHTLPNFKIQPSSIGTRKL